MEISIALVMLLSATADSLQAFWRLPCAYPVGEGRIDPIMAYGGPSEHLHKLFGGRSKRPAGDLQV